MPRTLVRAPGHDRSRSLGWLAVHWMEHFVRHGPGGAQGQPIRHGDEYTGFVVDCYAMGDGPSNKHMLYDSVFLSRPKGTDKSGIGARLALFEGLGPARFAGRWALGGEVYRDPWGFGFEHVYEPGEPMGRHVTSPMIRCLATEVGQVGNVYQTIHYNLTDSDCPLSHVPGIDVGLERVMLPWGGDIRVSTSSSSSKDGGRETFAVMDESHLYNMPELREMYRTIVRNLLKRKGTDGTWYIETTTMFAPGEDSIAEYTYLEAEALRDGRKRGRHRLLYDHRWGECADPSNEEELRAALIEAFGEAMSWQDLDSLVDGFHDTRSPIASSRRYFLNAQTSTSDAWLAAHEWNACAKPEDRALRPGDLITLGMDGSVSDDATGICAFRFGDGHLELLATFEKPEGAEGEGWQVDREAVDAAVANAMKTYEVVGFFADPAHWQDYLDRWHNEWADKMVVKASEKRPLEWWTNRPKPMVAALERFHEAVVEQRLSYTPAQDRTGHQAALASALSRHALNARRRPSRVGLQIGKDSPKSNRKIDNLMAAVLAFEAGMEAVAGGVKPRSRTSYAARRIR